MARVVKRAVYGSLPNSHRAPRKTSNNTSSASSASYEREDSETSNSSFSSTFSSIAECGSGSLRREFLRYSDGDSDEEESSSSNLRSSSVSHNFVDFISQRTQLGCSNNSVDPEYGTRHLLVNGNFKERVIAMGEMNKIFCSSWLNSHQVVFGTKCNRLSVYDIVKRDIYAIPLLKSSINSSQHHSENNQCGIHSLAINPSKTILATGSENTNDIAFYSLPTFDPLALGEGAHKDWMFDLKWLDDCFLVSGSRDSSMALWKLDVPMFDYSGNVTPTVTHFKALSVKRCKTAEKVRALAFNRSDLEIAAVSLNGYIHLWRCDTFKQIGSQKLHNGMETVCLCYHDERKIYAVGSRSHTTILDARSLQPILNKNITSLFPTCGVRSVSFRGENILTIGTGTGAVLFYDMRASRYMHLNNDTSNDNVVFRTDTGWVASDDSPQQLNRYSPAVYTHCYDESGTRLFAAGGPLAVEKKGNYAAVWS